MTTSGKPIPPSKDRWESVVETASMPAPPEVLAAFAEGKRARAFWDQHFDEYARTYPDQFVAVREGQVVASSDQLEGLLDLLKIRGLRPQDVWAEFIEVTPRNLKL